MRKCSSCRSWTWTTSRAATAARSVSAGCQSRLDRRTALAGGGGDAETHPALVKEHGWICSSTCTIRAPAGREVDLWITPTNLLSGSQAQNQERFFASIRREVREPIPVNAQPHWDAPGNEPVLAGRHGMTDLSLDLRSWQSANRRHHDGDALELPASTSRRLSRDGRRLGLAIETYLREQNR